MSEQDFNFLINISIEGWRMAVFRLYWKDNIIRLFPKDLPLIETLRRINEQTRN